MRSTAVPGKRIREELEAGRLNTVPDEAGMEQLAGPRRFLYTN